MEPGSSPGLRNQVPVGMLITEVTFRPDGSAELFGVWYYKEKTIPETREEGKRGGFSILTLASADAVS